MIRTNANPLAPRPMSPDEVSDLVARVLVQGGDDYRLNLEDAKKKGIRVTTRSRCAARYAFLVGCSITVAAKTFGISSGSVWAAWHRLYGDQ